MFTVLVTLIAAVSAHNWVNSESRSVNANPIKPSMPSQTGLPHLQAIAGQKFPIEWVTGHDSDVYWVYTRSSDYRSLLKQDNKALIDYINNAPAAQKKPPTIEWQKLHQKYNERSLHASTSKKDGLFSRILEKGDPNYIPRPAIFEGSFSGSPGTKNAKFNRDLIVQGVYKPGTCTDTDRKICYNNPKYPWIMCVQRYKICAGFGARPDIAWFQFPKGTAPGNYHVQYNWRGYYDIVDVQIVAGTKPVPKVYGERPPPLPKGTPAQYRKIDHCLFKDATPVSVCLRMRTDAAACKTMCEDSTIVGCQGVSIVPITNPSYVYKHFRNQTFIPYHETMKCPKSTLERNHKPEDRVCFPVLAREATQTAGRYVTTKDPDDPIFASSCLVRLKQQALASPGPPPPPPTAQFLFGNRCLKCDQAQYATQDFVISRWDMPEKCADCVKDGPKLSSLPKLKNTTIIHKFKNITHGVVCNRDVTRPTFKCPADAKDNVKRDRCAVALRLPGGTRQDVGLNDCVAMIRADKRCDDRYLYRHRKTDFWQRECTCYRKDTACCGPCVLKKDRNYIHYEI